MPLSLSSGTTARGAPQHRQHSMHHPRCITLDLIERDRRGTISCGISYDQHRTREARPRLPSSVDCVFFAPFPARLAAKRLLAGLGAWASARSLRALPSLSASARSRRPGRACAPSRARTSLSAVRRGSHEISLSRRAFGGHFALLGAVLLRISAPNRVRTGDLLDLSDLAFRSAEVACDESRL
jgi:hypothetical protein